MNERLFEEKFKELTPSYSWGSAEWGNLLHAAQLGAKIQLEALASGDLRENVSETLSNMIDAFITAPRGEFDFANFRDQLLSIFEASCTLRERKAVEELIEAYEGMLDGMGLQATNFKLSDWEHKERTKTKWQSRHHKE